MRRARRGAVVAFGAVVAAALVWVHASALSEAYGRGAPYYGRTVNMDKWNDPVPGLVALDALAMAAVVGAWRLGRRGTRRARSDSDASGRRRG